jgi:hypothetical protein
VDIAADSSVLPSLPDFTERNLVQHKIQASCGRIVLPIGPKTIRLVLGADVPPRAGLNSDSVGGVGWQVEFLNQTGHELGPNIREEGTGTIENGVVLRNETLDGCGLLTALEKEKFGWTSSLNTSLS